jgi:hypothetical protein
VQFVENQQWGLPHCFRKILFQQSLRSEIEMINLKQKQLIDEMFQKAKEKYPEIVFKELTQSPDDPDHIWICIDPNMDEDKLLDFFDFAAELDIDTLVQYGYKISLMPNNNGYAYS